MTKFEGGMLKWVKEQKLLSWMITGIYAIY
jgi:hypothetical protein